MYTYKPYGSPSGCKTGMMDEMGRCSGDPDVANRHLVKRQRHSALREYPGASGFKNGFLTAGIKIDKYRGAEPKKKR